MRLVLSFVAGGNACAVCGGQAGVIPLCGECEKRCFAKPPCGGGERCSVCGKTRISERGVCMRCRRERLLVHTDAVFPLYSYRLWNSVLLFRWKIQGERALSPFFASRAASALKALPEKCAVVPVPPRPGKIFREGRDQIDELSRCLRGLYALPVLKVLKRISSQQQKKLNRAERLARTEKRYVLKNDRFLPQSFKTAPPEAAVLLDDIITTGATLEICAELLKKAGVKRVYAITLFSC